MSKLKTLYQSSLGKKYIMALTGLGLFVFVIIHMLGNLQIFLGPDSINSYAEFLKSKPALLWTVRGGLLTLALLHITSAIQLVLINRRARPVGYSTDKIVAASLAARTIIVSGLIILMFIIYHLLHFTAGAVDSRFLRYEDYLGRHDVYRMMIEGFSNPFASAFYIVSMGLLCLHLSHGVSSTFQSLGLKRRAYVDAIDRAASVSAVVIFLGNCAIPIAVLAGLVK
ncbi:MAG: succinate dehydrogenase cytochrome b subunit [Acidobacteriota bacterium]